LTGAPSPLPATIASQGAPQAPTSAACESIAATGKMQLLPLPGAVRGPTALAMLQGRVYVAGRGSSNLGVIENDMLQRVLPAGESSAAIAADESLGALFVLDDLAGRVSMYKDMQLQASIPITNPLKAGYASVTSFLMDSQGHRLFVGIDAPTPEIVVVDTQAFTVTSRLNVPFMSHVGQMALDAANNHLLVSQYEEVFEIDAQTGSQINSVRLPGSTYRILVFDPNARRWFADYYQDGGYLAVIENGIQIASIAVGEDPWDAAISGNRLYVANGFGNSVSVIDMQANQVIATIPVGPGPRAIWADNQRGRVYVAISGGYINEVNRLDVIDIQRNEVTGLIPLAANVAQLVPDATRQRLYVLLPSSNEVLISDGQQVLSHIPLERAPQQMALDEKSGRLYVTDFLSHRLGVIDVLTAKLIERHELNLSAPLDAVAVDQWGGRVLVNNRVFASDTLTETGHYTLAGFTIPYGDGNMPTFLIANPSVPRIYAVASNGVPGSNGGVILYTVDAQNLKQLDLSFERNVSALVLDDSAQRVYETATHPLANYTHLSVLDALTMKLIASLDLPARVTAMALNEQTHHLFLTYHGYKLNPTPVDNVMQVLDTRTLGKVISFTVPADPAALAVLGDRTFVASSTDSSLTVFRDCRADAPPAPTPTMTPTPYPTYPPEPTVTPAHVPPRSSSTPAPPVPTVSSLAACRVPDASWVRQWFGRDDPYLPPLRDSMGCAAGQPRTVQMAIQPFTNGLMLWRADTRKITVVNFNFTWAEYDDTWDTGQPEGGTERPPAAGLFAPKRGFGKIWRDKLGGPAAGVGWATQKERSVVTETQEFENAIAYEDKIIGNAIFFKDGTLK
jgi:YVTN family beta-propeller protein